MQAPIPIVAFPSVPLALDLLVRLRPARAWLLVLLAAGIAAIGDLVTGTSLWFGPVYLFVICLASWSLGWRAGQATGIALMLLTFAINGPSLYPYGGSDIAWNLAIRFAAISLVIAVIAGARRAYVKEWWLARTDALTLALNRQAFFELGDALTASRHWRLLVYADLDGLKAINDGQGHNAGDACLRSYAAAVRTNIRRDDMFARVGGDEFLVFMAVKDEAAAGAVAGRLHAAMNRIPADTGGNLRCSVGALVVPPGQESIDELIRQADDLMYRAKQRGACLELAVASGIEQIAPQGGARGLPRAPLTIPRQYRNGLAERRAAGSAGHAARAKGGVGGAAAR